MNRLASALLRLCTYAPLRSCAAMRCTSARICASASPHICAELVCASAPLCSHAPLLRFCASMPHKPPTAHRGGNRLAFALLRLCDDRHIWICALATPQICATACLRLCATSPLRSALLRLCTSLRLCATALRCTSAPRCTLRKYVTTLRLCGPGSCAERVCASAPA